MTLTWTPIEACKKAFFVIDIISVTKHSKMTYITKITSLD